MTKNYVLGLLCLMLMSAPSFAQIKIVGGGFGGGFSRSISVSNENGVKTTRVTENGKKFVIRQGEDLIEVEFANTYGPNDMEALKEKHPDLHMHVTSFPKTSGEAKVELTISVKEKVSAENESALKEKSEKAFEIFEKYTRKGGGLKRGFGGALDLRGIDLGGIELAAPPKIVEIEKDMEKRMEEMRKKVEEMRKKARGPLFGAPKKTDEPKEDKKADEKDADKDSPMKKPSKKKLIDI